MKMKVKNRLATMAPGVDDIAEAGFFQAQLTTILLAAARAHPAAAHALLSDH